MMELTTRDKQRLVGVKEAMVRVVTRAATLYPGTFMVIEGLRTKARQAELFAQGRTTPGKVVTWTMESKHLTGDAVDLAPVIGGAIPWGSAGEFDKLAQAMKQAALIEGVQIVWGADWNSNGTAREKGETDSPHYQLK
jgi:peptidoglycan L-alanyl-D-glutamate endopeptidase CwlK